MASKYSLPGSSLVRELDTDEKQANTQDRNAKVNDPSKWPSDLKRRYEEAVKHIDGLEYHAPRGYSKSRSNTNRQNIKDFQEQAKQQLLRDFTLIASGAGSEQDIAYAMSSIEQITSVDKRPSKPGDSKDNDDPVFKAWASTKSASWFDSRDRSTLLDQRTAAKNLQSGGASWAQADTVNKAREAQGLPLHPEVDPEGVGRVGGAKGGDDGGSRGGTVDATRQILEEAKPEYIDDFAKLDLVNPERRDYRKLDKNELVKNRAVRELKSAYGKDPFEFQQKLDQTGTDAQKDAIGYYRDLMSAGGKDAVSQANLELAQQEAEANRRSATQAALSNLDIQGRSTGGAALQAQLQGAGQSMAQQYNAALQSAAMEQQRKDAAANQMAGLGFNLRNQQFSELAHISSSIDSMSQQRASLRAQIDEINSGRQHASKSEYERMQQQLNVMDAQIESAQNEYNTQVQNTETSARNRYQEGSTAQSAQLLSGALQNDATRTAQAVAQQLGLDAQKAQAFVASVANADNYEMQKRIIDAKFDESGTTWQDIAGAVLPAVGAGVGGAFGGPAGAQVGGALGSVGGAAIGGTPSGAAAVQPIAQAFTPQPTATAAPQPTVGIQPVTSTYTAPGAAPAQPSATTAGFAPNLPQERPPAFGASGPLEVDEF